MEYPNKTRRIVVARPLPFEPSMIDILKEFRYFEEKYDAGHDEVVLEERSSDSGHECLTCGDLGASHLVMVFSRYEDNENYESEILLWKKSNTEHQVAAIEVARQKKIMNDGLNARLAWKSLHRQERISRKYLGRHTLFQS